jgi:tetratricopeptide (TPR) repeat protein
VTIFRTAFLLATVCLAGTARAAEPVVPSSQAADDARRAEARTRYEEGVAAYSAGRFKDAVDLFLAADRLSPSAPLSFNIARAYEKLGDDSAALRWYRDYRRRAPSAPNTSEVAANIERLEGRLRAKGVQQLSVLSVPDGATVNIDDAAMGISPGTFDLPPGRHRLVLIKRGYADAETEVDLAAEHAQDVTVRLEPAPASPGSAAVVPSPSVAAAPVPVAPSPAAPPAKGFGVWPWVIMGAGAATLGGALTFEFLRQSAERAAEDDPTQIGYHDHLETMQSRRTTARVLAGVGGVLVITGGVLLTIDLAGRRGEHSTALRLVPVAGGATTALAGTF